MSLINEALKKAQRDRHLENLPASAAGNSRATARTAAGPSKSTLLLIATGVFVLFVVAVVGAVLFINREPAAKVTPGRASASVPPASQSRPAETVSPAASPIIAAPAPVSPPPPAAVPPTIVISLPSVAAAKSESVSPAVAPVKADAPPPAPAAEKFDPRLQTMVDGWHINLVRVAGPDSRLFMNGTSYRIGDTIDRASGLKLTEVSTTTLTFTDSAGSTYSKRH